MWKVGDVEPVRVMGAEGYPYGFNVTTEDDKPVVLTTLCHALSLFDEFVPAVRQAPAP